ncbi:hypothetical protein [Microbacterium murale]|uniref:DUF4393 domain-containing protein n=1 Tax=Microbacterium murale TaxID=1081040 RepID=A0ABU0P3Y1_9MICO|nr:hypothetical protein [Microbacterium murale]MDQ0642046.1 hypothetical protein [Microbacterium murale]
MSEGDAVDPIITGAIAKAGEVGMKAADSATKEAFSLLSRLLGPSADVIGEDWADRLRQKNMTRLLKKTEKLAAGKEDPGWAQPRVANAVFEAAQYANDEIVTDYLSGVLASSREPDGGTDDALPWSSLVSRLSALQLRIHYVLYLNLRQVLSASEDHQHLYDFESKEVAIPMREFLSAVGLDPDQSDFQRFADALQGLMQEDLVHDFAYGPRDFFTERDAKTFPPLDLPGMPDKRRVFEPPYVDALLIHYSQFGVQFFLWGVGMGMGHDVTYLDPNLDLSLNDPDALVSTEPLTSVSFSDDFWTEHEIEKEPGWESTTLRLSRPPNARRIPPPTLRWRDTG